VWLHDWSSAPAFSTELQGLARRLAARL
jgi:hypothetical protein